MAHKKQQEKLIFDTLPEDQKDFFIQSLEKKVRNLNKKLKEIKQLETDKKEGRELNQAQLSKIASKDEHNSKKKELEGIAKLYLEAKAEDSVENKDKVAATQAPVSGDAISQISNLFFAAQYAYQTNSNTDLALYFTQVFNSVEPTRVELATAELTAYVSGANPALQAQVIQVTASEGFSTQTLFVSGQQVASNTVEETQEQEQVAVVEEPEQTQEAAQTEEHVHHHVHHHHHHHHHHEEEEVKHAHHAHHEEKAADNQTTEQTAEQTQPQGENVAETEEANKEQQGEKKHFKKPYQKRNNSGNQGPRKPREPRAEGEHQQTEGGEHKRGPRTHHNGPRHGGNRSNKRNAEGENQENENTSNTVNNDGWNVVSKGPKNQEGTYKPRTREGGNHHHNNNNQKRTFPDGQKRPNHSGNKRPFNKERTGEQQQYVRKDKTTDAPQQQQEQIQESKQ